MTKTNSASKLIARLESTSADVKNREAQLARTRDQRDEIFYALWKQRVVTVTSMAKLAGIRRETVHDAINRVQRREEAA